MEFFNQDILRDEEKFGGFNPGEPDDDTFALGDKDYPAEMSDFDFPPDLPVPIPEPEEETPKYEAMAHLDGDIDVMNSQIQARDVDDQADAILPDEDVGDLWSSFNEEANLQENNGVGEIDVIPPDEIIEDNEVLEPEDLFTDNRGIDLPIEIDEPTVAEPEVDLSEIPEEIDENIEIAFEGDVDAEPQIEGELDQEFLAKLSKEIKEKPTVKPVVEAPIPVENIPTKPPFDDNDADTQIIDLNNLGLSDSPTKAYAEETSKTVTEEKKETEKEVKPKKEKKKKEKSSAKSNQFRMIAMILGLFFLVFGSLIYFGYMKLVQKPFNEMAQSQQLVYIEKPTEDTHDSKEDSHKEAKEEKKEVEHKTEPAVEKIAEKEVEKHVEENIVKPETKIEIEKKAEKHVEKQVELHVEKPIIKKEVPKVEKPKLAKVEPPKVEKTITEKVVKEHKEKPVIVKEPKPKVEKPLVTKVEKPKVTIDDKSKSKNNAQIKIPEDFSNINRIPPLKNLDEEGIFTVQIYSSPSKEDAYEWLNKLKQKKVTDGFITEQRIRDQVWYRVRFGQFKTRDEARKAAVGLGFSQSWVDRVK